MIYILGVSLGMLIANIYMGATNPQNTNMVYINRNKKNDYFEHTSIFIFISVIIVIAAVLGIVIDTIVAFGIFLAAGILAGIVAIAFNATT
jgi:hypothetical protein